MKFRKGFLLLMILTLQDTGFARAADSAEKDIPEVEVIGSPVTESLMQQDINQMSLSADEVISMPGTADDLLRALDTLPGINQVGDGVYMHGSSTSDNRLLVDKLSLPYLKGASNNRLWSLALLPVQDQGVFSKAC